MSLKRFAGRAARRLSAALFHREALSDGPAAPWPLSEAQGRRIAGLCSCPGCGCWVRAVDLPDGRALVDPGAAYRVLVEHTVGDPYRDWGQAWGLGYWDAWAGPDAPHECPPGEHAPGRVGGPGRDPERHDPDPCVDPEAYSDWLREGG